MQILKLFILLALSLFFIQCDSPDKPTTENNDDSTAINQEKGSTDHQNTSSDSPPVKPPVCEGSISELTIELCTSKDLSWLIKADTQDSYIRIVNDEVTWVRGTWNNGEWYGNIWIHGVWENGIWHEGTWEDGRWKDGYWRGGLWNKGNWENGTWTDGMWTTGVWKDGYWRGGVWQTGLWKNGTWHKGTWNGGTWEDGKWWGGVWNGGVWRIGSVYHWDSDINKFRWIRGWNPPSKYNFN